MTLNNLGKTVEQHQAIRIADLLVKYRLKIKESMLENSIEISGHNIELATSKTGNGGTRYWFKCPLCSRRAGMLFVGSPSSPIACRQCLGIYYRKQRYKGMIESALEIK